MSYVLAGIALKIGLICSMIFLAVYFGSFFLVHTLILHVSHATMKLKLKLGELNKCFNDCCLLWNVVRNILMWTTFSRRRVCQLFTWKSNWIVLVLKKNNIRKYTLALQIVCEREHKCDFECDCDCDCDWNWNCERHKYKMNTLNSIQPRKWTVF